MKKLLLLASLAFSQFLFAQNIDTLAFQDFEVAPAAPVWTFTGPVIYNSGFSSGSASPANSPLGIGGSRAWETTTNSGGLVLDFANTMIPSGYDTIRVRFNLAAMNLLGAGGGPDNLDYVLVAYSVDGGTTYNNRIRVRGATNNDSYWPYSATGVAKNYYLPATEQTFQPTASGPQTTLGYSTVEIAFPGTVTQIAMRITGRSSSSTDTWLIDNLVMTGETSCAASTSSFSVTQCGMYVSPSGNVLMTSGIYNDTIPNASGCDSVITINLTVNNASSATIAPTVCGIYTSPSGNFYVSSGTYYDTIPNAIGCDSLITINLTVLSATGSTLTASSCTGNYTLPSGNVVTSSGTYYDTIPNAAGCDSVITASITVDTNVTMYYAPTVCIEFTTPGGTYINTSGIYYDTIPNPSGCDTIVTWDVLVYPVDTSVTVTGATMTANVSPASYQWIDCGTGMAIAGETLQWYTPPVNGNYAVIVYVGFCHDTSSCINITSVGVEAEANANATISPNPFHDVIVVANCTPGSVVTVYNLQGEAVYSANCLSTAMTVDLSAQANGIYFVQLKNADTISSQKVIKY